MQTTTDMLDKVKGKFGLPSDYALAGKLGVTRAAVSNLRNKKDFLGDSTALKVADLLDIDPAIVVSAAHAERAKKPEERAVWESIYKRLTAGVAVAVLCGIGALGVTPQPATAAVFEVKTTVNIMLNIRSELPGHLRLIKSAYRITRYPPLSNLSKEI